MHTICILCELVLIPTCCSRYQTPEIVFNLVECDSFIFLRLAEYMPKKTSKTGSELFIVDNSETDWKVAKYLHDSLPNATYVGFTGTPIDATLDVFGEIVDAYTLKESVDDEITVRIVYEGRAAKVLLDDTKLAEIEGEPKLIYPRKHMRFIERIVSETRALIFSEKMMNYWQPMLMIKTNEASL